jgi:hypothetical protein
MFLPTVGKIAERHPGLKLIVDHMGVPRTSERVETGPRIGNQWTRAMLCCVERGRIQLNKRRRRVSEQGAVRRCKIGEPGADREDQFRFHSKCIGRAASDAGCTNIAGVVAGECALAGLHLGHRRAVACREVRQPLAGERIMHTAAGDDEERLGLRSRIAMRSAITIASCRSCVTCTVVMRGFAAAS